MFIFHQSCHAIASHLLASCDIARHLAASTSQQLAATMLLRYGRTVACYRLRTQCAQPSVAAKQVCLALAV